MGVIVLCIVRSLPASETAITVREDDNRVLLRPARFQLYLNQASAVQGFQFFYPHQPVPGRRLWLKLDKCTWVECYPSGEKSFFRETGRGTTDGRKGTIVTKFYSAPSPPGVLPNDGGFQIFIPDHKPSGAIYRKYVQGRWEAWANLGEIRAL